MQVIFNEQGLDVPSSSSLFAVLEHTQYAQRKGIAVAVNNKVVPRAEWPACLLQENDKVLVITATKGG